MGSRPHDARRAAPGRALRRRADEPRRGVQERPCRPCSPGPPAASAARRSSRRAPGFDRILTFDMGGTSTDVAVWSRGRPEITRETNVGDFPVRAPAVDVASIGAGGGSIAYVAEADRGAQGRAGERGRGSRARPATAAAGPRRPSPTRTSCSATCPPRLLGGEMKLDVDAAHRPSRGSPRLAAPASRRPPRDRGHGRRGDARRAARGHRAARPDARATSRSWPSAAPAACTRTRWRRSSAATR